MSEKMIAIYQDFTGGAIDAPAPLLPDNCSYEGQNIVWGERGGFDCRKGSSNFHDSYGAYNITELIEWPRKDGSRYLLAMIGNTLAVVFTDWPKVDVKTLDNGEIGYFFWQDKFYFTGMEGGVNKYFVYDGTDVKPVLADAPSAAPTMAGNSDEILVEDCEDVWNEYLGSGVTCELDTADFKVGAASVKFTLPSSFSGIVGTEAISALSLVGYTHLKFWTKANYASTGIDAILLDDTAACASPLESLVFGVNNEWTQKTISLVNPASDKDIISVGLKRISQINSIHNIWLDDLRAIVQTSLAAGTYKGKVSFIDSNGNESLLSPEASVVIAASQRINWTNIPLGPAGTAKRRLYRTEVNGSVFKKLVDIDDNTTGIYYDTVPDSSLGEAAITDNVLGEIAKCRMFAWHPKSLRIFAAGNPEDLSCLYFSEANDPAYFKETNKLYPTTEDGPVTALALFGEGLMTFYRNSIWFYRGSNPAEDATWSKLPVAVGTVSPKSIAHVPGHMIFLGYDNIYALSPGILEYNIVLMAGEGLITNLTENKQRETIKNILFPEKSAGVYFDGKYHLAYSYDPADQYKKKILVLDWSLKAFATYTNWNALAWCVRYNRTLLFGTTGGYIKKCFEGYNDTGNDIPIKLKTRKYDLAVASFGQSRDNITAWHTKKLKRFLLALRVGESAPAVSIKIIGDKSTYTTQLEPFISGEFLKWGDPWGEKWWFATEMPDMILFGAKISDFRSRGFQVEITFVTNDSTVSVIGLGFEFKVKTKIKQD
jgi:hypothetical protein